MECKKKNFITSDFAVKKIEDVTLENVRNAFLMTSNVCWEKEQLKEICEDTLKQIKGVGKVEM